MFTGLSADNNGTSVAEAPLNHNDSHRVGDVGRTCPPDGATSSFSSQPSTSHFAPESSAISAPDSEVSSNEKTINNHHSCADDRNDFDTESDDPALVLECSSEPEFVAGKEVLHKDSAGSNETNNKPNAPRPEASADRNEALFWIQRPRYRNTMQRVGHYCTFCGKLHPAIGLHLVTVHRHRLEVSRILRLPAKSKERHEVLQRLTAEGDSKHRQRAVETGGGLVPRESVRSSVQTDGRSVPQESVRSLVQTEVGSVPQENVRSSYQMDGGSVSQPTIRSSIQAGGGSVPQENVRSSVQTGGRSIPRQSVRSSIQTEGGSAPHPTIHSSVKTGTGSLPRPSLRGVVRCKSCKKILNRDTAYIHSLDCVQEADQSPQSSYDPPEKFDSSHIQCSSSTDGIDSYHGTAGVQFSSRDSLSNGGEVDLGVEDLLEGDEDSLQSVLSEDSLIRRYASLRMMSFSKSSSDQIYNLRQELRVLGRLVVECRRRKPSVDLYALIHPDHFNLVVAVSRKWPDSVVDVLTRTVRAKIVDTLQRGDSVAARHAWNFRELLVLWRDSLAQDGAVLRTHS